MSPTLSCTVDEPFKVITGGVMSVLEEGHVPHIGLFELTNAEASLVNSSGSEVMLVTHHLSQILIEVWSAPKHFESYWLR